jgi:hypothetical protein
MAIYNVTEPSVRPVSCCVRRVRPQKIKLKTMTKNTREKALEKTVVKFVESLGCLTYKFTSPGCTGVPDRIVILPGGSVWFIELKTEQGIVSQRQGVVIGDMTAKGARVMVVTPLIYHVFTAKLTAAVEKERAK